jgi:hypothetical protein
MVAIENTVCYIQTFSLFLFFLLLYSSFLFISFPSSHSQNTVYYVQTLSFFVFFLLYSSLPFISFPSSHSPSSFYLCPVFFLSLFSVLQLKVYVGFRHEHRQVRIPDVVTNNDILVCKITSPLTIIGS